jgi:hypothetical protein
MKLPIRLRFPHTNMDVVSRVRQTLFRKIFYHKTLIVDKSY